MTTFGGLSPQEAGRKGAEARRKKREAPALSSEHKIEAALRRKAEAGDVQAARESREWISRKLASGPRSEDVVLSLLTNEQLATVEKWIRDLPEDDLVPAADTDLVSADED
jgi:hypothetical protein